MPKGAYLVGYFSYSGDDYDCEKIEVYLEVMSENGGGGEEEEEIFDVTYHYDDEGDNKYSFDVFTGEYSEEYVTFWIDDELKGTYESQIRTALLGKGEILGVYTFKILDANDLEETRTDAVLKQVYVETAGEYKSISFIKMNPKKGTILGEYEASYKEGVWESSLKGFGTYAIVGEKKQEIIPGKNYYKISATTTEGGLINVLNSANTIVGDTDSCEEGLDYTITAAPSNGYSFVKWTNISEGISVSDITNPTATVVNLSQDVSIKANFAKNKTDISKLVSLPTIPTQTYMDKPATVSFTINIAGKELVEGTDYKLTYKNNNKAGTATVTMTGIGNYTGSISKNFIIKENFTKAEIADIPAQAYTGSSITPEVSVTFAGKKLEKNKDYVVAYSDNRSIGQAPVVITGMGDYSGSIRTGFSIKKALLKYRAYGQKYGWQTFITASSSPKVFSSVAGTEEDLRMETIQMQLKGVNGEVRYRAYCDKLAWTDWATTKNTKTYAGTKGQSRRVEMIQLQAKGEIATLYDIYYQAYSWKFGWLGWAGNNQKAGSAGYASKLCAFRVQLVPKGTAFNKGTKKCFYDVSKDGKNPQ